MKPQTLRNALLAVLVLGTASAAQAQEGNTTSSLSAQVGVTRDTIDSILKKIGEEKPNATYVAGDYWRQVPAYKKQVEEVLVAFEARVKSKVLSKVSFWVDQYNAKVKAGDSTSEMLTQQLKLTKAQIEPFKEEYLEAIREVYRSTQMRFEAKYLRYRKVRDKAEYAQACPTADASRWKSYSVFEVSLTDLVSGKSVLVAVCGQPYRNPQSIMEKLSESPGSFKDAFQALGYPLISQGCESRVCLGLRASDVSSLAQLIQTKIDRDLLIVLADNNPIKIEGVHEDLTVVLGLLAGINYPNPQLPEDSN